MRKLIPLVVVAMLASSCGDDVNEGSRQSLDNRGTIDGVVLEPGVEPEISAPDPETSTPSTSIDPIDGPEPSDDAFGWTELEDGIDEGYLRVPIDHDDPNGETIELYLVRHRAVDPANRIGTLLVNPGGPGVGGTYLAYSADFIYGQDLLDRFDIIGWDPRGTGYSEGYVDCISEYDDYFGIDSTPDSNEEVEDLINQATEFADACEEYNAYLLPYVSTVDSARDMDLIREALGEETISYFGFSYGSELGATWATLFPDTVRAAVLDGAVDPTLPYFEQNLQQAAGFEASFNLFLDDCAASPECAFHNDGDPRSAFLELVEATDERPIRTVGSRVNVSHGVLYTAVAVSMYDRASWPELERALADAQLGDGAGLLSLYDQYYELEDGINYTDGTEGYFAIACLDDPGTSSPEELLSREAELAAAAPLLGRSWLLELMVCAVWPEEPAERFEITGADAGPIVVVGTTDDPATPLASTRVMADTLEDGRLVIVYAQQHTGYGVNRCVDEAVDQYLVDPRNAPIDGLECG